VQGLVTAYGATPIRSSVLGKIGDIALLGDTIRFGVALGIVAMRLSEIRRLVELHMEVFQLVTALVSLEPVLIEAAARSKK
jgi:hypothetical protein